MGQEFFYDWTEGNIWDVIKATFEPLWQQDEVDKVKQEFDKLKGTLASVKG